MSTSTARTAWLGILLAAAACQPKDKTATVEAREVSKQSGTVRNAVFVERAKEVGVDFVHFNGMIGEYYYPEMMGGGGAMVDFDVDGDLDLYFVQGSLLSEEDLDNALFPPAHDPPFADRLYRNDSSLGTGNGLDLAFVDVTTVDADMESAGYGMGVASGDIDNDGFPDLYRTAFGQNQLLHNDGAGGFSDHTARAAIGDRRWSVPAVFFDFDRDGWLDLYVGNYLNFTMATHKICRNPAGAQDYCGPTAYSGVTDRLFHNLGNGTFEDVSASSGVGSKPGKTLGAVAADLNQDGWLDLYVTNDGEPNFLWINQGDGTFVDEALWRGCAVNAEGLPQASMGVDAGDFDNDGDFDLFMTHLTGEANALFRNDGDRGFTEISGEAGLGASSWPLTSFGTGWIDFDNDGWLDLFTLSGAVKRIETLAREGDLYPLHQLKQLYRNAGNGTFEEVSRLAGKAFGLSEVGRGAALGDVDNDGDSDVMVFNSNGPARLLVNQIGSKTPWVGFRILDPESGRDMIGSAVVIEDTNGPGGVRRFGTDGGYASANDPRLTVGTGSVDRRTTYRLIWPDGRKSLLRRVDPENRYVVVGF